VHKELIAKKLPFVDERYRERSFEEGKLIELMEECWAYKPSERCTAFEAVSFLRDVVKESNARIEGAKHR